MAGCIDLYPRFRHCTSFLFSFPPSQRAPRPGWHMRCTCYPLLPCAPCPSLALRYCTCAYILYMLLFRAAHHALAGTCAVLGTVQSPPLYPAPDPGTAALYLRRTSFHAPHPAPWPALALRHCASAPPICIQLRRVAVFRTQPVSFVILWTGYNSQLVGARN